MVQENFPQHIRNARRVATPLLAIQTVEPSATMRLVQSTAVEAGEVAVIQWDLDAGLQPRTDEAAVALGIMVPKGDPSQVTNPVEACDLIRLSASTPELAEAMIFLVNGQFLLGNPMAIQALANLREPCKAAGITVVLIGPSFTLPPELQQDVVIIDEPLPNAEALRQIVDDTYTDTIAGLSQDDPLREILRADQAEKRDQAAEILTTLGPFAAEQTAAGAMTRGGVNLAALWSRKKTLINQTPGLTVDEGQDLTGARGLDAIMTFAEGLASGPTPPLVVVRVDEIGDAMAGSGNTGAGDNTGVSQALHGYLLKAMEQYNWPGMLCMGAPGTGKTLASRLLGQRLGALTLELDLGAVRDSLLGNSERNMRAIIKMIHAAGGQRVLWVGTTNSLDNLTPQLRRRFQRRGLWYFPMPDEVGKRAIWSVQCAHYELEVPSGEGWPDDTGWVGAEIRNCCEMAYAMNSSLLQAARYVVPVSLSDPEMIDRMERTADGKFLNAAAPGVYERSKTLRAVTDRAQRRMNLNLS